MTRNRAAPSYACWRTRGRAEAAASAERKRHTKVSLHPCPEHVCVQDARRYGTLWATRGQRDMWVEKGVARTGENVDRYGRSWVSRTICAKFPLGGTALAIAPAFSPSPEVCFVLKRAWLSLSQNLSEVNKLCTYAGVCYTLVYSLSHSRERNRASRSVQASSAFPVPLTITLSII